MRKKYYEDVSNDNTYKWICDKFHKIFTLSSFHKDIYQYHKIGNSPDYF